MRWLDDDDLYYWNQGTHYKSYQKLGAHPNAEGVWFAVWAPHAEHVSVIGAFNDWDPHAHPLERTEAGIWEGYVRGARPGQPYKYRIVRGHYHADKTDPYAFHVEPPVAHGSAMQGLSSVVEDLAYDWNDGDWMAQREGPGNLQRPVSIYEVHLGSWKHESAGASYGYRSIAEPLADYVEKMGFTHVELLPVAEHPYYASWGYQVVGYFAPTFRYGPPRDLMYLIDHLHQRGIGVLVDWVPAHFATDPQGLVFFDGSTLYEYDDPLMRTHPDWGTYVFDYNKPGVRNFLISNALFWLDKYHVDGLRVDAVASMLYRDYSRDHWTPNMFGGRENLEAIDLLKKFNEAIYTHFPTAMTIAEESTAWPGVSAPTYADGLGFLFKWNMGWMHDTLEYFSNDPVHRKWHQDQLTFSFVYAFSEHYVLPISHDEVVHGKGSLWRKMAGDPWQKAANLRVLYAHMFAHPGKKLLFMGSEFGQEREWNHDTSLDWHLLDDDPLRAGLQAWVADLNALYTSHPAFWNDTAEGYAWIAGDKEESTLCYKRVGEGRTIIVALNFTPVPRGNYRIGVPEEGTYREVLNSDAQMYGGGGIGNFGEVETHPVPYHGQLHSIVVTLPPLGALFIEQKTGDDDAPEVEITKIVEPEPAAQQKAAPKKKAAPKEKAAQASKAKKK